MTPGDILILILTHLGEIATIVRFKRLSSDSWKKTEQLEEYVKARNALLTIIDLLIQLGRCWQIDIDEELFNRKHKHSI